MSASIHLYVLFFFSSAGIKQNQNIRF